MVDFKGYVLPPPINPRHIGRGFLILFKKLNDKISEI